MFEGATLLSFIAASTLLCLAPGPDNIFVLTQSAINGRRAGLFVTLGICSGLIVHTIAVALGLAAIFQVSALAFTLLKLVGVAYLLYLAWGAFKSANAEIPMGKESRCNGKSLFKKGAIMNMTNPKVAIFFLAFLPQFVPANQPGIALHLLALGLIFIAVAGMVFGAIAIMSGSLGPYLNKHPSSQKILNRIAGSVFVLMALRLLNSDKS